MKRLTLIVLLLCALPVLAGDSEAPAPMAASNEAPSPMAAPTPRPTPGGGPAQLFQVLLLRGTTAGTDDLAGVPKNAEKAIRDIRDFLPFKSYRLLDSALLRISDSGKARLDGIPPQQYDVRLAFKLLPNNKLSIWDFNLIAVKPHNGPPLGPGVAPEAERALINTSFTIDLGETIVVGSSKLGGNEALIVLLTAVPK